MAKRARTPVKLQQALRALQQGQIVLVYDADGREEETDMVCLSEHVTPDVVRTMRTDAGGLLCTAISPDVHHALGLPFLTDVLQEAAPIHPTLRALMPDDIQYDGSKPAFGLTINHRSTFTGITDEDRSTTIQELATFIATLEGKDMAAARTEFGASFRAPGHVILLNGAPGGLESRQGHTEISLELARQAGAAPSATVCEMLDPESGKALSRADAENYAVEHGLVFLTGEEVQAVWQATATA